MKRCKTLVMCFALTTVWNLNPAMGSPVILPDEKFELYLESVLKESHSAGVAVGIISDGKLSWSKGFGYRDIENKAPVTPQTVFNMGSITKSFTSTLAGMLVDQGKLDWDAPIQTVLPEFNMIHESSSKKVNLVHLLSHQTGMPGHDFVWIFNDQFKRTDVLQQVPYLEALPEVGKKFQYNNLMYAVAGIAIDRASGKSWEKLIKERILQPLQMKNSSTSYAQLLSQKDHARPYEVGAKNETILTQPVAALDAVGPAGSVNSNLEDMSRYVLFHLNGGAFPGEKPLISSKSFERIHSPVAKIDLDSTLAALLTTKLYGDEPLLYQLGWIESKRHGLKLVEHSGDIRGYASQLLLVPEKGIGVILLSNTESFPVVFLAHDILDHLLGKEAKQFAISLPREAKAYIEKDPLSQSEKYTPSQEEIEKVLGNYAHTGNIFPFSVVKGKTGLEFIYQDQRVGFIPRGKNLWSLETEDSFRSMFLFEWSDKANGFYLKHYLEDDGPLKPLFQKKG